MRLIREGDLCASIYGRLSCLFSICLILDLCGCRIYISDGKSGRVTLLAEECQACIAIGVEVLDKTIHQLLTGQISLAKLKLLATEPGTANFLEVFRVVEKNAQSDVFKVPESGVGDLSKTGVLQKVILWRKTEQQSLESVCRHVSHFTDLCRDIQSGWWWILLHK